MPNRGSGRDARVSQAPASTAPGRDDADQRAHFQSKY
jgi:hypothetical protein